MLYTVHAHIKPEDSYRIRKLLHENNFYISLHSRLTLNFQVYDEDYLGDTPSVPLPQFSKDLVFDCVYNSHDGFPPYEVLQSLETDPAVQSYGYDRSP